MPAAMALSDNGETRRPAGWAQPAGTDSGPTEPARARLATIGFGGPAKPGRAPPSAEGCSAPRSGNTLKLFMTSTTPAGKSE
ncbi:hypothetical protein [Mycobacterium servetii]|uniref:Uncharacterized protein n=1 Tax=Mycobacterium servetii TaxID=3237418 RepID=A0ABV4C6H0_9MYCO